MSICPYDMTAVMSVGDYNMVAVMSICPYDMADVSVWDYDMAAVMSVWDYDMVAVMSLCDYDMGSCDEQGCSCQHGEKCECDEAEAVQHHGGELPVVLYRVTGFVSLHLVRQNSELLQDHCELPHRA